MSAIDDFINRNYKNYRKAREAASAELIAKDEALRLAREEADKLRRNMAKYFASAYRVDPAFVAEICDEQIDRTGALLGYVREEVAALAKATS